MTIIQKIVKAGDLPPEWAKEFADPNVTVEVRLQELSATIPGNRLVIRAGELTSKQIAALLKDDVPPTPFDKEWSEADR